MAAPKLTGIFTPHMVPMDERGRINEPELRRLVEWLIQRGVHGLYPNGSTGEFTRFSYEERREIVRIVTEQADGRVTVMAGAAEANLDVTLEACNYYHSIGCDTVAIVPPPYFPMRQTNVREFFVTVARHSPIDVTVYKIPQFTTDVTLDTLLRLAEQPKIIGIKDSSRDFPGYLVMMHEVRKFRPDFSFLIGCEEILVPSLLMGGNGGTIATSGVVPELVVAAYDATLGGDLDRARTLQYSLLRLIHAVVFGAQFPEGVRAALELRGFRMGKSRLPTAPEEQIDIGKLKQTLSECLDGLGCSLDADGDLPAACKGPVGAQDDADEDLVRAIVEKVVRRLGDGG